MATGFQCEPLAIELIVDESAIAGLNYTTTRTFDVVDALVVATAAVAAAVMTLSNGAANITDGMACAVTTDLARPTTITAANATFVAGDTLRITASGGAVPQGARCLCYIFVQPPGVPITLTA